MLDPTPRTILVVEDEFLIRMLLAETLVDEGYQVAEAGTADEGITLLRDNPAISLMITDLTLPGSMDGLALVAHARAMRDDLPVIFVTGRPDAIGQAQLGARDAVIAKPYLPSQIAAQAARILRCEA